jgi:hypothetical protein
MAQKKNVKKITKDMDQLSALFEQEMDKTFPERKEDKTLAKKLKKVFNDIVSLKIEEQDAFLNKFKDEGKVDVLKEYESKEEKRNSFQTEVIKRKSSGRILGPDNVANTIMTNMYDYIEKDPANMATYKLNAKRLLQVLDKPIDEKIFKEVK